ncbi:MULTISPECIES: FAD assembly factor SdhE [Xanthobacter]|uniref:FAD assembly factor SdhE n=1 Tax=Xanthobacter TaxID=279 RepID=UPI001F2F6D7C|nr:MULTISPECIES: succinate dehydrogenase assembly factor 2 [unclassified Xanthobacter]
MSGTQRSSADLDPRRRRLLYRAWHRGMREMDLIMGKFADAEIGNLSDAELDAFENLIDAQDHDIFSWISETKPVPGEYDTPLFTRMKAFHDEGRGVPE